MPIDEGSAAPLAGEMSAAWVGTELGLAAVELYSGVASAMTWEPPPAALSGAFALRDYLPILRSVDEQLLKYEHLVAHLEWPAKTTQWFPTNWSEERGFAQYRDFIELAKEGLPLTWVPNLELTYLIADAAPGYRTQIILDHAEMILRDCEEAVMDLRFTDLSSSLKSAIEAGHAGNYRAALALAASVFDAALRQIVTPQTWQYYKHVESQLHNGDRWGETEAQAARLVPTSVAVLSALDRFDSASGQPVPTKPNRHAAAHTVHPNQYNNVNALKFLMLDVAMLTELEKDGWSKLRRAAGSS